MIKRELILILIINYTHCEILQKDYTNLFAVVNLVSSFVNAIIAYDLVTVLVKVEDKIR